MKSKPIPPNHTCRPFRCCANAWVKHKLRVKWQLVAIACALFVTQTGCQMFGKFRGQSTAPTPVAFAEIPTKDQILAHIAKQTERAKQIQSDVRVSVDGMPTLRGTMAVEKPNRMRMNAGLLGVTDLGIDVGSNENVFWFWAKVATPGEEPGIYFAKHDEYRNSSLQQTIPIEPAWLIEALGLLKFEPNDRIEGPYTRPEDGRFELRTYRNVGNQPTLRKTVIDPKYGWIVQQSIYDADGRLLAYATSSKHEHYPEHNISLPGRIEINANNPDGSQFKLTVDASRYRINSIYGDPEQLWTMPNPGDVPVIDLVKGPSQSYEPRTSQSSNPIPSNQGIQGYRTSSNIRDRTRSFINQIR